ncbi:Protein mpe1 [Glugoides intestinalis]
MVSNIFYRFKSYKEFSTVGFEGNILPLWELKYEIVSQRKMNSKDFDLLFFDEETNEQLLDEYAQIPRNSRIIVQRIPAWMSKTGLILRERKSTTSGSVSARKLFREPPENYVCFRCGNKGHFIQHCPTNNDKSFDILKIRKPSGIPKDFLVKVAGDLEGGSSKLVTEEGFVMANPQTQEWKRQGEQYSGSREVPKDLQCHICGGLFRDPVITNCGHVYCDSCMVLDSRCEVCGKQVNRMNFDDATAEKVKSYLKNRMK